MKALSVRQPWAARLLDGSKPLEYRSWQTRYRGPVVIHAASKVDERGMTMHVGYEDAPRGALVGMMNLTAIEWDGTRYAWTMENPVTFAHPIPYAGTTMLFTVPDALLGEIECLRVLEQTRLANILE